MTQPNVGMIAELIERDLSLSHKLLKLINSATGARKKRFKSLNKPLSY